MNKFYVYEWYNLDTNEVFYVGKGCGQRYKNKINRNQLFLNYINNHSVNSRIVKNNLTEDEAFEYEKQLTEFYQSKNECQCNLINGGYGGYSKVWTDQMKQYMSINNPMKDTQQRERMRQQNPMFDANIAKKSGEKHKRPVIINGVYYKGTVDAAKDLSVWENTILNWCKRGYNTKGEPCHYADSEQIEFKIHKTNSKPVLIDGVLYGSLKSAVNALGANDTSNLSKALKAHKKYKGHICEYANQQPT